jgi:hypothetical protein
MIPPSAMHYVGQAVARAFAWGAGQLASRGIDALDLDVGWLSRLDEPALLEEIARRDEAASPTPEPGGDRAARGRAIVDGLLPLVRGQVCPHRDAILAVVGAPEVDVIKGVAACLHLGVPALVAPVATLLVKRGLPWLCGPAV